LSGFESSAQIVTTVTKVTETIEAKIDEYINFNLFILTPSRRGRYDVAHYTYRKTYAYY